MKYELNPYNRGVDDEVMLGDLRRVAAMAPSGKVTTEFYARHGRFHWSTVNRRFKGWNKALAAAGIGVNKNSEIRVSDAVADIKRVAKLLRKDTLTSREYSVHGEYSGSAVGRLFGGWLKALAIAGLAPSRTLHITDEQWFRNIATVWDHLGRQPSYDDMDRPPSVYSPGGYAARFGGWRKALEAFIRYTESEPEQIAGPASRTTAIGPAVKSNRPKTPRTPGWRLEYLVKRRDRYRCRACGRSPANEAGIKLHVDHVVAWSKGGPTTVDNLQTLCNRCNVGKSNLDWQDQV